MYVPWYVIVLHIVYTLYNKLITQITYNYCYSVTGALISTCTLGIIKPTHSYLRNNFNFFKSLTNFNHIFITWHRNSRSDNPPCSSLSTLWYSAKVQHYWTYMKLHMWYHSSTSSKYNSILLLLLSACVVPGYRTFLVHTHAQPSHHIALRTT